MSQKLQTESERVIIDSISLISELYAWRGKDKFVKELVLNWCNSMFLDITPQGVIVDPNNHEWICDSGRMTDYGLDYVRDM